MLSFWFCECFVRGNNEACVSGCCEERTFVIRSGVTPVPRGNLPSHHGGTRCGGCARPHRLTASARELESSRQRKKPGDDAGHPGLTIDKAWDGGALEPLGVRKKFPYDPLVRPPSGRCKALFRGDPTLPDSSHSCSSGRGLQRQPSTAAPRSTTATDGSGRAAARCLRPFRDRLRRRCAV